MADCLCLFLSCMCNGVACLPAYLDGVIGVRSSPTVLITRRPQTKSPMHIPTPPKTRIQIGI